MSDKKDTLEKDIELLVIEQLKMIPPDKKIYIGGDGDFTTAELIERVKKNDEVGQKIKEVQMEFLRSLKTGVFFDE